MIALDELFYWLHRAGLNDNEINILLGKFLEQEAQLYIDCISSVEANENHLFS